MSRLQALFRNLGSRTPKRAASIQARTPLSQIPANRLGNAPTKALIQNIAGWHQVFPPRNRFSIRRFNDAGD